MEKELKPFDKILVRNSNKGYWIPALYGFKSKDMKHHLTSAGWQDECIPYEGNEEYLGTNWDYVCPEIVESEDEKIRKAMIKYFTNGKEYLSLTPYSREDYIAWLEKQGEQKPVPKFKVGDVVHSSNGASLLIVGITDYCYNCVTCATNDEYSFGFDIQDEFKLVEQKPANWLQELEDKLANATPEQLAEWKEKYFKEEPTEWSKEDECNVINICAHLRSVLTSEAVGEYRNWFEILRQKLSNVERNGKNWKPSEEQIRVVARLRHCLLEDVRGNDVVILDDLLEQLKAL